MAPKTQVIAITAGPDEAVLVTTMNGQPVALLAPNEELVVAIQEGEVRIDI